jgi:transcriptional regulator with XRE-family HTH domain
MATKNTNDKKRAEMAALIEAARSKGWSIQNLAVYFGVSPSTVSAWARGDSMGTNSLRAALAGLKSPEGEKDNILSWIADSQREATRLEEQIAGDEKAGAHEVAKWRRRDMELTRRRGEALRGLL